MCKKYFFLSFIKIKEIKKHGARTSINVKLRVLKITVSRSNLPLFSQQSNIFYLFISNVTFQFGTFKL